MSSRENLIITSSRILSKRGPKNKVDPFLPYAWMVEKELTYRGTVEDTGIIFLTNRECPYRCLMCDLWKNTTDNTVPEGAISQQIKLALEKMPGVKHIKLYNSGSFFDRKAVPVAEYESIAELLHDRETVIVECHPKLIDENVLAFREMLKPDLQIALGLECADNEMLRKLNKGMTTEDFKSAVNYLTANEILTRAFILLRPPFLTEEEGISWTQKSLDFAFDSGVECCIVIPVRGGNGIMEELSGSGHFSPPEIKSLERVLEYGINLKMGRVFADTWDLNYFSKCGKCSDLRKERIENINLSQLLSAQVVCDCK
jgi:radical SAM enzyme (TIGR01210 family)